MAEENQNFQTLNAMLMANPSIFTRVIAVLKDAARKYGSAYYVPTQRRLKLELDDGRVAWVHLNTADDSFIFVSHVAGRLDCERDGQVFTDSQHTQTIAWSNFVSVAEVMAAVVRLDAAMAAIGRFDPATGIRSYSAEEIAGQVQTIKANVDETFVPLWATITILLEKEMNAEEVKDLFDRPEDVIVNEIDGLKVKLTTARGEAMCREALQAALDKLGYTKEFLQVLSKEAAAEFAAEITRYLKNTPK